VRWKPRVQSPEGFFLAVDRAWDGTREPRIPLRVIGSVALMLQTDYARPTNDGDVLETIDLDRPTKERLLASAGKGTKLAAQHGMYVDLVADGLPFLPRPPVWHPLIELNHALTVFEVAVLDIVDVVVAKLKRFHANDRSDIKEMVDRDLVPHDRLVLRFRSAFDIFSADARAEELPHYRRNLHQVERDMLGVPETEIELPNWI